ncbi:alpha/beta hydrolase [Hyphomonas sp. FCG-A18]|uniref:alpha/beta hydrolase family protein n=1 Tax=Hyphomonas sp. FCG-A18 TaxID=3080019 RepID=UPI002B2BADD9|nr:alpha/beta hydrolase [Hyphomonas sp. FCG-A18]
MTSLKDIPEDKLTIVKGLAAFAVKPAFRTPVHKTPRDHGITEFEDIYFQSDDGTPLEGWYVPAAGGESDKLIIMNHPMPMSRSGFTGHWGEPWSNVDDLEIDFVAILAHLVRAGYNVLSYDLRNHGNSGTANGGICGIGRYEWRDCVGVKAYVDAHPRLSNMTLGLYSQCTGGNAQYEAIYRRPDLFKDVRCLFSPLVVSMDALMGTFAGLQGVREYMDVMNFEQTKLGGFTNPEMTPHLFAGAVQIPTMITQVHDDAWTTQEDGQQTFDLLGSNEKELFWIEGTSRRFDGYNYFGQNPERMLAWFGKYMG